MRREKMMDRFMRQAFGNLKGKSVLEIGCGNGYWTRFFRRAGAKSCLGVDHSADQIKIAERDTKGAGVRYLKADGVNLKLKERFDVIYVNFILDEVRDVKARAIIRTCWQQLKPGGKLVVGAFHPAVYDFGIVNVRTDGKYRYFREESLTCAFIRRSNGDIAEQVAYHRSMGRLTEVVLSSPFLIDGIWEPRYTAKEAGQNAYLKERSEHPTRIIISARKA
jgi:ubiquinone/menaquinone biosynthesis C-methylase UbiE